MAQCSEDNHCNLDHGWGNSSSPGVRCGCHRSPCLTGSHLKSPCAVSDCPLSPVYPLSAPLSPCHTHITFLHPSHNSVLQQLSPSATSVPCPLREDDMCLMAKITALSTFSVSSAAGTPRPEGGGVGWGGLSEWHVCTAQRLQKRFNVADMLFCLLLCTSLLISSMDKQFKCAPSKPLQLIRNAEEPEMKSRMTLTSISQLVLHFLLFTLTVPRTGVHDHA